MKKLAITEEIWKEGNMYTSYCPELDIAACGHTIEDAKKNLIEVIKIQIEETAKMGTLDELLWKAGYDIESGKDVLELDREIVQFEKVQVPVGIG